MSGLPGTIGDQLISTERLDLVPIPLEVHVALNRFARSEATFMDVDSLVPYAITEDWPQCVPSNWRQPILERDASLAPWLTRAIVLREEQKAVGAIGFHDYVNADGMGEIGYQVIPEHRRKGIAREALVALVGWGYDHGVKTLRLTVDPENEPSIGLIQQLGLVHVGEQMDEIDGLELIYERSLPLT